MAATAKKKLHLLIAEGDKQTRSLYRKHVSEEIFEIVAVATGDPVQDAYIYKRPDIMLLDANLEGKSGIDLIKWVRIARRDHDTSIILTSASADSALQDKCNMLGVQGFLIKPLDYKSINTILMDHHQGNPQAEGEAAQADPEHPEEPKQLRVLIAEDDKKVAILYQRFLSQDDFSIQIVGNGAEAMKSYSEWKPDVVILNLHMPELSGQEFLMEVRGLRSDFSTTVIIATSESSTDVVKECARYEIQGYLIKPFNLKKLGSFIKSYRKKHVEKLRVSGLTENS